MSITPEVEQLFCDLFERHQAGAIRYARRAFDLDYDAADQIVTDAFLCLREALNLGEQIQYVNTWLRHNIHARYVDWVRTHRRVRQGRYYKQIHLHDGLVSEDFSGFEVVDCREAVQLALGDLNRSERAIAKYVLIQGNSVADAAKRFRSTLRTMERRISTVRAKLHESLCVLCDPVSTL